MVRIKDYESSYKNQWCPGCGNFGILEAMKAALVSLKIPPEQLLIISGIGQAAKTPHFLKCNMFHALHGRALPLATGAKMANHNLKILVNSGDGDCYGEGGNHFMHAIRRNVDLTLLVHNNKTYGLTKGQASPTSDFGMVTPLQLHGVISESFNPLAVALSLGAGFVARGFSGNMEHLSRLIQEGISHKGFSLIDILQPCVSFNRINTYEWYKKRVYDLFEENYVPNNFEKAMNFARQWDDKIPIGIIYKEEKPTFTDRIEVLNQGPLISQKYDSGRLQTLMSGV
ncbi:MAG: 2-oxoacid:ferredoxin oxidoreductase subunit beta [Deltaproteobacteria bacterium]|jgi:2-oxoglutarate ferredoxin oxidoreductase subunit beta|nr:2-oxoacid:ferredoxin oxidoreductase subunit beta [Deltaproteobacteria bacterium]